MSRCWTSVVALFVLALPASGQGRTDYLNFETPQVHPVEVVVVDGHPFLAMVNTPDSSVELWDTDESVPIANRFRMRLKVGQEPVSVRFHAGRSEIYTANHLGDSISRIRLTAPGGPGTLAAQLITTTQVADEPMDIAFYDKDDLGQPRETLFVTHMTLDGFSWLDALNLEPLSAAHVLMPASVQKGDLDGDGFADQIAIKEPRSVAVVDDCLYVLGTKGGNDVGPSAPALFDYGLFTWDLTTNTKSDLGNLGSTNLNMAFAANGDLFVVGHDALNETLRDEPVVAAAKTGFVESRVYMVRNPCSAPQFKSRDVNEKKLEQIRPIGTAGAVVGRIQVQPVVGRYGPNQALSLLTDAVVYEPAGGPLRLFFTAMGNDRVGVLEPKFNQGALNWKRRRINLSLAGGSNIAKEGPRGIALAHNVPGTSGASRLYVLNRLGNSFAVLDPDAETELENHTLGFDPRPDWIRIGQRFLYDAQLSKFGHVSCASCHMDGRTDGLSWDLGTPGVPGDPIDPFLHDFVGPANPLFFEEDKERMVTQSLQGLLNFETEPATQYLMTNAPYHWRGDREDFVAFQVAFDGLLKNPIGELPTPDMEDFEEFINSIHYPPNPKQPIERDLSGELGDPDVVALDDGGSGAERGAKIFHIANSDGRSCSQCHALTEGSNNRFTEFIALNDPYDPSTTLPRQVAETAAMRGLFQREARLDVDGSDFSFANPITGLEGLTHTGWSGSSDQNAVATINAFNSAFQNMCLIPSPPGGHCQVLQDINQFFHELDWGVAPGVGFTWTVDPRIHTQAGVLAAADRAVGFLEQQAHVTNVSVVAHFWGADGTRRGFWYDVTAAGYNEELSTGFASDVISTRAALYNLVVAEGDRMVFEATPLGSERRIAQVASPANVIQPLPLPAGPSDTDLETMRPNTAYQVLAPLTEFSFALEDEGNPSLGYLEGRGGFFSHTVRLFQHGLLADGGFGLPELRHDAPRRFRVAGRDIRQGASLILSIHDDPTQPVIPPDPGKPLGDPSQPATLEVELPIYPSKDTLGDGRRIWETAVELEPLMFYRLMLGGPFAPGVDAAWNDSTFAIEETFPPGSIGIFDAAGFNWVFVEVENPDGQRSAGTWQPLTID